MPKLLFILTLTFSVLVLLALGRQARRRHGDQPGAEGEDPADWWKRGKKRE